MANLNFDLDRLLTGVSNRPMEVQEQPIPGSPSFSGDFGAQTANSMKASLGKLVRGGRPTQAQQLNQAEAKYIAGGTIEDLKQLAKIQVMRKDREGAAKTAARIQELLKAKTTTAAENKAQAGFLEFIKENYPTYEDLAKSGAITAKNWSSFIKEEKGKEAANSQFGKQIELKDEDENLYFGTQKRSPSSGDVFSALSPVGNAPAQPVGKLSVIGAFGQTAGERDLSKVNVKGGETAATKFSAQISEAPDIFATSSEGVYVAEKMLNALENFSQGGFIPSTIKAMTDVIGMTPADIGDFEIKAQEMMIAKLSAFGANPTEGEARRAAALVASIKKTKGLNIRLINDYKQEMKRRASRAEYLLTEGASIQGYNDFSKNQYKSLGKEEVRNFGDLE